MFKFQGKSQGKLNFEMEIERNPENCISKPLFHLISK